MVKAWIFSSVLVTVLVGGCKTPVASDEASSDISAAKGGACQGVHCVSDVNGPYVNRNAECNWLNKQETQGKNCPASYYPSGWDHSPMGPGFFACDSVYQKGLKTSGPRENLWFVAPADTHNWVKPCPYDPSKGVANCFNDHNNSLCGRKVKVSCAENCKPGGPKYVIAAVMDFCSQNHPDRARERAKSGVSRCQSYHAWDIATGIWELMRGREDNVRINFEVLPPNSSESTGPKY